MGKSRIVSRVLRHSGMLYSLRRFSRDSVLRILMYHRVFERDETFPYYLDGVSIESFDTQMEFLANNFSVVSLEEAVAYLKDGKRLPKNAAAITIDDGYKDCYTHIYPILRKYNLPVTIFLASNHINSTDAFWVDKIGYIFKKGRPIKPIYEHQRLSTIDVSSSQKCRMAIEPTIQRLKIVSEKEKNETIDDLKIFFQVTDKELKVDYNLNWSQIREMSNNGISFGAHTASHPILTKVPLELAEREIKESKERIEGEIGKAIYGFCYPNGGESDFNDDIIAILKRYRFKYAVTSIWGFNGMAADPFSLKRVGPNADDGMDRFDYIVSGGFKLSNRIKNIAGMRR